MSTVRPPRRPGRRPQPERPAATTPGRRSATPRAVLTTAALLSVALVATGCGGSSPSGAVAHLGSVGTTSSAKAGPASSSPGPQAALAALTRFAACVRAHGDPGFSDPQLSTSGGTVKIRMQAPGGAQSAGVGAATFQSAQQACRSLLPATVTSGGSTPSLEIQAQYLKAAACVRLHGVPNLPDPTFVGGVHVTLPAGLDQSSPQVVKALAACKSLIPSGAAGG